MAKNIETTKPKVTKPKVTKLSKKKISESVYEKIAGSLAEYNLQGKKFDSKLKKVSRLFAVDIAKATRKKEKAKAKETTEK